MPRRSRSLKCCAPFGAHIHGAKKIVGIRNLKAEAMTKLRLLLPEADVTEIVSICLACKKELDKQFDHKFLPSIDLTRTSLQTTITNRFGRASPISVAAVQVNVDVDQLASVIVCII